MARKLELFWADVLSKDPDRILNAIDSLSEDEKGAVIQHLEQMAFEPGWTEGQRDSARKALETLEEKSQSEVSEYR